MKITVTTPPANRVSINTQQRTTVKTVGIGPGGIGNGVDTLEELLDVDASGAGNNEVLVYNETTSKYEIKPIPAIDGGTFE